MVSASILSLRRPDLDLHARTRAPATAASTRRPPPPELAPSCGANGVLGVMAGVMGLLQANEVMKLVLGIGEPLIGRLLLYEALGTRFTELKVRRDPECPICGPDAPEIPESEMGQFPDYEPSAAATSAPEPGPDPDRFRPMPTVRIPPVLRQHTDGATEVDAGGSNVGDVLQALVEAHPDTKDQLFSARAT